MVRDRQTERQTHDFLHSQSGVRRRKDEEEAREEKNRQSDRQHTRKAERQTERD